MQVTISVAGRFHAFYLAQQLMKRGVLRKLITSYPRFEVAKYGIPRHKADCIVLKEFFSRGAGMLPHFLKTLYDPGFFISNVFDTLASRRVENTDIFVGWSGYSLSSLQRAAEGGAMTILERGSAHISSQHKTLQEEYDRLNLPLNTAHPRIITKELKEYEEAHYVSVPSRFAKETFLENGFPESRLIHNPYGVDMSEFRPVPKTDNIFRVLFIGHMSLRKGVHYLLETFAKMMLPEAELLLVGPLTDELKPFFKRFKGTFTWIGPRPQSELYKYYSQSSLFVLPSIEDGFGLVLLQAMACGLPVICTTNTGGADIVEENKAGFVIPIRDRDALEEKILFFYENREQCRHMGQMARQRVSDSFTWDHYGERMVSIYEELLQRGDRRARAQTVTL